MPSTPLNTRPGLLLVHPRLHKPSDETEAQFLRWTKLHNADLLTLPAVTRTLRFSAHTAPPPSISSTSTSKYSHSTTPSNLGNQTDLPALFYTILTSDIEVFKTKEYYAISRRLDLENTRALTEGEERVDCAEGMMVWDIVDARFGVFEEIEAVASSSYGNGNRDGDGETGIGVGMGRYADIPGNLVGSKLDNSMVEGMRLVVLAIDGADGDVRTVQSGLVRFLEEKVGKEKEVFTGVYRNTGAGGQPDMHPVIEQMMGGAKWLILTLVVDKTGEMEKEQMDDLVGNWVKGMNGESRKIEHGVWNGELVMG